VFVARPPVDHETCIHAVRSRPCLDARLAGYDLQRADELVLQLGRRDTARGVGRSSRWCLLMQGAEKTRESPGRVGAGDRRVVGDIPESEAGEIRVLVPQQRSHQVLLEPELVHG
jgi:hypothetical protein